MTLRPYFHLPMLKAARQLGLGSTMFKKICRMNNIRWPSRKIISLTKSIQSVEMAALTPEIHPYERDNYKRMSLKLRHAIDLIIQDPNTIISEELFNIDASSNARITAEEVNALPPTVHDVQAVIDASIVAVAEVDPEISVAKKIKKTESEMDQEVEFNKSINFAKCKVEFTLFPEEKRVSGQPPFCFHAPVHLTALKRQNIARMKRVIPLVEPDVSHQMVIDLDPAHLFIDTLKTKKERDCNSS